MSWLSDVLSGLQQAALLKDKVDRALKTAEDAQRHSTENRERIVALETAVTLAWRRPGTPRLPRG
ncbi:MAG: hypothetical protein AVDCRST_MAG91-1298 [uncultured Sphingomonadaceae bacterium]|uniref:Uncharacterized protein n=1 Tax=uncultured Sphingomonadaceae bacterium TaxID=169976 RepID=A0A6J4SUC8_9SPHN|nr:MAG: hypothetical protein AVDCRST_MAG91-1298 [uncultured Sphingomonadaceae bacterium]